MFKLYQEHPDFEEYTKFDTTTGRLQPMTQKEFRRALPKHSSPKDGEYLYRVDNNDVSVYQGSILKTHTRFPRRVYFQITRNCNLHCPACFIRASKRGAHVPFTLVKEVAVFMGEKGLMEVRLTGGEPTAHPNFFEILHEFKERNVYVSVATNGVFDCRIRDALAEEKNIWIICSLDGNRETHNKYRGNTYDIILKNLEYLKAKNPGLRIRLTTVLTKDNKGQMAELGEVCKSIGAESITVIPLRPQVRDPEIKTAMVTSGEFRQVIEDLVEAKKRFGIEFTTTIETDYKAEIYSDPIFTKRSSCAAGREGTNLDYDAVKDEFLVYGCSYSPASDLQADPEIRRPFLAGAFPGNEIPQFLNIWKDDNRWTLFRDLTLKSPECKRCEYYDRQLCTGSCPIQNVNYSLVHLEDDVLEQLKKQIVETSEWYCYKHIYQ